MFPWIVPAAFAAPLSEYADSVDAIVSVEWVTSADGDLLDALEFYAPEMYGLTYEIVATVHFGFSDYTWTVAEGEVGPLELVIADVQIPWDAFMEDSQWDYLSELHMRVLIGDGTGQSASFSAPVARVAMDGWWYDPLILDEATAAELAPGDAWAFDVPGIHVLDEDFESDEVILDAVVGE